MSKPIQLELFGNPSKSDFSPIPSELTVYSASAGSGKTHTLTLEYLKQALSNGYNANKFREILAVTFTNKATDEMKIRIIKTLNDIANGRENKIADPICRELNIDRQTLKDRATRVQQSILHNYSSFSISTIDKFFQKVIHAFVREAGLRPGFRLELDRDRLIGEAIDRMMLNIRRNDFLYRHISDVIDEQMEKGHSWDIRKSLQSKGYEILKEQFHEFDRQFHTKIRDAAFMSGFSLELKKIMDDFEKKLNAFAGSAISLIADNELSKSDFFKGENGAINYFYKLKKGDYSLPAKAVEEQFEKDDDDDAAWCGKTVSGIVKAGIQQISGQLNYLLRSAAEYHKENYRRYFTAACIKKAMVHLGFFAEMEANIRETANDENLMPISETTRLLGKLINESDAPFIYERTGSRYGIFMIDEFQDTSEAQWRNFKPLLKNSLSEGRSSLVVGDVKQSIYRWRNGDWRILAHKIFSDFSNFTVREKNLDTNWRSFPKVIEFNNALFSALPAYLEQAFYPSLRSDTGVKALSSAYRNVKQKISENNMDKGGYVSLSLIIKENDAKADDKILEQLPKLIADMQDRGYRARDIAILVRDANYGRKVSDCLLNYADSDTKHCFDIVYQDALLVNKSATVKFIISLMKAALNPDDKVNNALINYFLNKDKPDFKWDSSGVLDSDVKKQLSVLTSLSLPEVFERLIRTFDLGKDPIEIPYIQELHDTLISFSNNEIPDISSFIEYWDAESGKMNLSEGKTPEAI
ncbi:MAG: UvrD-helicase domain-containing protein, partial [Prevotellaceae bacterium]|nr:UvrD-helicase domain-containing protein [Prevotellaceae bacterium]